MNTDELRVEIIRNKYTNERLANELGINKVTLWSKMTNKNEFTLKEIREIKQLLKLSDERFNEIFLIK